LRLFSTRAMPFVALWRITQPAQQEMQYYGVKECACNTNSHAETCIHEAGIDTVNDRDGKFTPW